MKRRHYQSVQRSDLAEVILGGQDGLVNVLGLVLGLVAANSSQHLILAGGLAAAFAESISMGAVVYTSRAAERDEHDAVRARYQQTIRQQPAVARDEVTEIFAGKGFSGNLLQQTVNEITSQENLWLTTLMTEKTDLVPLKTGVIVRRSLVTGVACLVGSVLPLVPFFLANSTVALIAAVTLSAVALYGIGYYVAKVNIGRPGRNGLQLLIIGLAAAFAGYVIGWLFRQR